MQSRLGTAVTSVSSQSPPRPHKQTDRLLKPLSVTEAPSRHSFHSKRDRTNERTNIKTFKSSQKVTPGQSRNAQKSNILRCLASEFQLHEQTNTPSHPPRGTPRGITETGFVFWPILRTLRLVGSRPALTWGCQCLVSLMGSPL